MTLNNRTAFLLTSLLLLLLVPAFARTHNQTAFTLSRPAKLAGVQLAQGDYLLKWEGEGEGAHFTILQKDRVIGTVVGTVRNTSNPVAGTAVQIHIAPDGSRSVVGIELPNQSLLFESNTGSASGR
jgi:hypothetical protein